jgi:hypothetical protein
MARYPSKASFTNVKDVQCTMIEKVKITGITVSKNDLSGKWAMRRPATEMSLFSTYQHENIQIPTKLQNRILYHTTTDIKNILYLYQAERLLCIIIEYLLTFKQS